MERPPNRNANRHWSDSWRKRRVPSGARRFSFSAAALHHPLQRHRGGGGAVFDAEFRERAFEMLLHSREADAEKGRDLVVGLAAGHPEEHLGLARGEAER